MGLIIPGVTGGDGGGSSNAVRRFRLAMSVRIGPDQSEDVVEEDFDAPVDDDSELDDDDPESDDDPFDVSDEESPDDPERDSFESVDDVDGVDDVDVDDAALASFL